MALTVGELTATLSLEDQKFTKGLKEAEGSFEDLGSTAKRSSKTTSAAMTAVSGSTRRVGKAAKEGGTGLTRFGKVADSVDNRAMGFRDSLTGVQDTMLGVADLSRGQLFTGLFQLGAGVGDLGSAIYNGLIPALQSAGGGFRRLFTSAGRANTRIGRVGRTALKTGGLLGGLAAAGAVASAAFGDELNPQIEAAQVGLERFSRTGETSGEIARLMGEDFSRLGDAVAASSGWWNDLNAGAGRVLETFTPLSSETVDLRERIGALDQTLARMVQQRGPQAAAEALQRMAEQAGLSKQEVEELKNQLPQYAAAQETAKAKTDEATRALERQIEALKRATDPVFALTSALRDVDEAQTAYNEAVAEHGPKSAQARDASLALAEAVAGAEVAARNGNLSFGAFSRKLDQWVAQGHITAGTAATIRDRVREARGQAEAYQGTYTATVGVNDRASGPLSGIMNDLMFIGQTHMANVGINTPPGRQHGGPVTRARPYIVGERGPEIFVPRRSGTIIPNDEATRPPPPGAGIRARAAEQRLDEVARGVSIENFFAPAAVNERLLAEEFDWLARGRGN